MMMEFGSIVIRAMAVYIRIDNMEIFYYRNRGALVVFLNKFLNNKPKSFLFDDSDDIALALPEKEVIQPHLPVRLPCYDFTPVTSPAFGIPLLTVKVTTSGMASSHSVTGGVYKARE
ncbi:hypothetical protein Ahy_A04g019916 [Arachis hypogaea]|uniref:Uncharacterized protein n=1 Tax=Arachis hypogaea TaxID=3818 RepID=A0A445DGT2_ARAHY|nr:hypothetical protein Ahy_A04g019916 [Arachis hypogaea]